MGQHVAEEKCNPTLDSGRKTRTEKELSKTNFIRLVVQRKLMLSVAGGGLDERYFGPSTAEGITSAPILYLAQTVDKKEARCNKDTK